MKKTKHYKNNSGEEKNGYAERQKGLVIHGQVAEGIVMRKGK